MEHKSKIPNLKLRQSLKIFLEHLGRGRRDAGSVEPGTQMKEPLNR
jgi:hypothetical protein